MNAARIDFRDDEIRFRVIQYLGSRHFREFDQLQVSVKNGSVTLSGKLSNFYHKQVAIHSCQRVAGVIGMIDRIRVQENGIVYSDSPT